LMVCQLHLERLKILYSVSQITKVHLITLLLNSRTPELLVLYLIYMRIAIYKSISFERAR
jgi:hypothetical protein